MKSFLNFIIEDQDTHESILKNLGFAQPNEDSSHSVKTWNHPEGHYVSFYNGRPELKGKDWAQPMPGNSIPKHFKKQVEKMINQKRTTLGPKAGQGAMPDSKGKYHKAK